MALFNANMVDIHVLLVGNDVASNFETGKLLEFFSYKVTAVTLAAIASSILAKGKTKYDVVLVDVSSSDILGFHQLARDAINLGHIVIMMSSNPNATLERRAIEDGAFMFIQKPATMDVLKYLWQHVLREHIRKTKEVAKCMETTSTVHVSNVVEHSGRNMIHEHGSRNTVNRSALEDGTTADDMSKKVKICMEWDRELHKKFTEAVKELGEGRCYPKEILKLMNVPGLKRMQVASHLQKCRKGWNSHQGTSSVPSNIDGSNNKPKGRGSYPRIPKGAQPMFLVEETNVVEDLVGSVEPNNIRQNIEISQDINVANNIDNEIPSANMNGEMVVEPNHERGKIPFGDSLDFGLDNRSGVNDQTMDYNFEAFSLDEIFSQISPEPGEDPGSFSNLSRDK